MNFLHITDTHLLNTPHEDVRGFNTFDSFLNVINKAKKEAFDFIIVSGDISQTCTEKSYQLFHDTVKKLNKPVYCIPGNHDNPELMRRFFPSTPSDRVTSVKHNETLIIFVNTQVPNQQHGNINQNNLNEISQLLQNNKTLNIILVLHHPPILINSLWMDNIGLKNGDAFMHAVQNHLNLKLILFGHVHQQIDTTNKHIKICATPSTCYQFKPLSKTMQYDNASPGYRLVKIEDNGTIESHVYRL